MMDEIVEALTIIDVIRLAVIGISSGIFLGLTTLFLQSVLDIFKNLIRR